jgi:hypothetical protein
MPDGGRFAGPDYLEPNALVAKGPLQDKIPGLMRGPWWKNQFLEMDLWKTGSALMATYHCTSNLLGAIRCVYLGVVGNHWHILIDEVSK